MQNLEWSYEGSGSKNYLQVQIKEDLNNYQLKMLEQNEIPGLLRVHHRILNGEQSLYYDITGMQRLKDISENGALQGEEAKRLFGQLLKAMADTEEYFLTYTKCFLSPEHIYVKGQNQIELIYLPFENTNVTTQESLKRFVQTMLADHIVIETDSFFVDLLLYCNKQEFSFAGLLAKFETLEETAAAVQPKEAVQYIPLQKDTLPVKQEKPEPERPEHSINIPGGGIIIPGMGGTAGSGKKIEEKKEKPEKSGGKSLFGSLLGGKKEKETKKENVPVIPKGELHQAEKKQNKRTEKQGQGESAEGQEWHGTVILDGAGTNTVVLGATARPTLRHREINIPLSSFPFTVGKENADYVIARNVISRTHIKVTCEKDTYYVEDCNSTNHTYINDKLIAPYTRVQLKSGDSIRLGDEKLKFYIE